MKLPTIRGIIDRRILANYRIEPMCMAEVLPQPFRPKLYEGYAIGGICLIRLKQVRPKFFPLPLGISSENAAHRIAVEWDENGETKEGVYVPRRDTNSYLNSFAGGRLFPGVQHFAKFDVIEDKNNYSVTMNSIDNLAKVSVSGLAQEKLSESSVFKSLDSVSRFFEKGSLGYSDSRVSGKYDGMELECTNWNVEALEVTSVESSYFENEAVFPKGSVEFDCAILMKDIEHEWHGRPDLCCS